MSYPTYLCTGKSTTGDSAIIDIRASYQENTPPVLHVNITGSVNYTVNGSHDMTNWIGYGTFTSSEARDLVIAVRFWKVTVNTISGTISAGVGGVPDINGNWTVPALVAPDALTGA